METWSDSQYGDCASVSGSTAVTAGKSYRTVATVTVWNGSSSESKKHYYCCAYSVCCSCKFWYCNGVRDVPKEAKA